MCILFIAIEQHQDYPLIIAANRDEFFDRPTMASHFWEQDSDLLAGKDEMAGGTWMGATKQGRIASLTNIRDPKRMMDNARTRGELVKNFLTSDVSKQNYYDELRSSAPQYNGYNLLFGNWDDLVVYNNHLDTYESLKKGVYGLSNANLNSPWPKINKGMQALDAYCYDGHDIDPEVLFALLQDRHIADDELLPKTGVPLEWERKLSSIFINTEGYGTRSSTVLMVDKHQHLFWYERTYNELTECVDKRQFDFKIATD